MKGMKKEARKRIDLFELAESQQGFFTAKQAGTAGFLNKNHGYHVKAGNWVREGRGIYRLRTFPRTADSQLIALSLWTRNREDKPEGVYSHETALSIHDLSDVMPAKLHMTVPKHFRRVAKTPKALVLHYDDLKDSDIEQMRGYRVTKPLRAIVDLLNEDGLAKDLIRQAFLQAIERGVIPIRDTKSSKLSEGMKNTFTEWLKQERDRVRA